MKMEGLKIIESFTYVPSCRINTLFIFNPSHIFGSDFADENFHVISVILQIESVQMLKIILQKRIT